MTMTDATNPLSRATLSRIYRLQELTKFVGLRRTQIAEMIKAGTFPKPIPLSESGRAVGWLETELVAWQQNRMAARNAARNNDAPAERRLETVA
jgi:prophage regulatory protein